MYGPTKAGCLGVIDQHATIIITEPSGRAIISPEPE